MTVAEATAMQIPAVAGAVFLALIEAHRESSATSRKTHPLGSTHPCRSLPSGSIPAGSIPSASVLARSSVHLATKTVS